MIPVYSQLYDFYNGLLYPPPAVNHADMRPAIFAILTIAVPVIFLLRSRK